MSNDERIIELLSDMLIEQKKMGEAQHQTNQRLENLEMHQAKTNIELADMRHQLMIFPPN